MNFHYELHIAGSLKFAAFNVLKKTLRRIYGLLNIYFDTLTTRR